MKRLCVVIVNYKTSRLTIQCIESLLPQLGDKDCIVVVDNDSGKNDSTVIKEFIENIIDKKNVDLIVAPRNGGFSYGNNIGIRAVEAEFYMLLNADTIVRDGCVAKLLSAMNGQKNCGMVSPRLEWPDGEPQISCFRFHSPAYEIIKTAGTSFITRLLKQYDVPIAISSLCTTPSWTSFACVVIKKEVLDKIGLLDEGYFMYYEDVDFCRRADVEGYEIINVPEAHVVHLRGQSSGLKKKQRESSRLPAYYYASRSRYYIKFYGYYGYLAANLLWYAGWCVSLFCRLLGRKRSIPNCQYRDIWQK